MGVSRNGYTHGVQGLTLPLLTLQKVQSDVIARKQQNKNCENCPGKLPGK
jgi:hypothetical protein